MTSVTQAPHGHLLCPLDSPPLPPQFLASVTVPQSWDSNFVSSATPGPYPNPQPSWTPALSPSPRGTHAPPSPTSPFCGQLTSDLWLRWWRQQEQGRPPICLSPHNLTCSPSPLCPPHRTIGKTCESHPRPSCTHRAAATGLPVRNLRLAATRGGNGEGSGVARTSQSPWGARRARPCTKARWD